MLCLNLGLFNQYDSSSGVVYRSVNLAIAEERNTLLRVHEYTELP
jgi:hypothetical protein